MSRSDIPYWRLSGFYWFYFATVGTFLPFWGLYLESLEFSPSEIGELSALLVVGKVFAPYLWGWIADHKGQRMPIIRFAGLASCLIFIGALYSTSYWPLATIMLVFGFFWSASLPQFEAVTLNHLGDEINAYTRVRLWGSIGFIVTVIVLGMVLEKVGVKPLPWIVFAMITGIWITSLWVPVDQKKVIQIDHEPISKILKQPVVIAMLGVFFLMQVAHGPYYSFYSLYLEDYGYTRTMIGQLWAFGVIAEVGIFLIMIHLLNRFSLSGLLISSLLLGTVRWILIARFPEHTAVIIFAQLFHAATFGIHHAIAIQLIHRYFKGQFQGRGQALYSSLSFGAGGALGALVSGYIWDGMGASQTFYFASLMSLLGALIAWRWVRNTVHP